MAAPAHTIRQALSACGIDDVAIINGQTNAQRMASEMFLDSFQVCMDKTYDDLKNELKIYASLTIAEGRIRILPGVQNRIRAFIQWTRDQIRQDIDPSTIAFPIADVADLLYRKETHDNFIRQSNTLAESAKPRSFTKESRWEDFKPNFISYLRLIPGRLGHPLSYVIRDNDAPDYTPNPNFLDDYVATAPLNGPAFQVDNATVHTMIQHLISGNEEAESKVVSLIGSGNGRRCYQILRDHYH